MMFPLKPPFMVPKWCPLRSVDLPGILETAIFAIRSTMGKSRHYWFLLVDKQEKHNLEKKVNLPVKSHQQCPFGKNRGAGLVDHLSSFPCC